MAGLGLVPSGSIVSRTPCRMSPSSWKLASLTRSGSIHASMNCLDRSSDAASLLSLSLALLLSLDPRRPAPVPPTAGLEYRERVALVVGGALIAAAPGVPGVGSPPFFFDVLPRGPAALLLTTLGVCACEHHPVCNISNYSWLKSGRGHGLLLCVLFSPGAKPHCLGGGLGAATRSRRRRCSSGNGMFGKEVRNLRTDCLLQKRALGQAGPGC